jgi:large subunit ribosomal protein L30
VSPRARTSTKESAQVRSHVRVTQVRSEIGTKPKHRGTLRALGLRGIGRSRMLLDGPDLQGMLARIPHLVEVEQVAPEEAAAQRERLTASRRARRTGQRQAVGQGRAAP